MDEYIKRKRRIVVQNPVISPEAQSSKEITIRQCKSQVDDLILKLKYIDERTGTIKQKIVGLKNEIETSEHTARSKLLAMSSSEKSSVTNPLFDGKTSTANPKIQQHRKLGSNEGLAQKLGSTVTQLVTTETFDEKHEQLNERAVRKRKSRI